MIDLITHLKKFPYILAPMASITNAPFRLLMREMGSQLVISELISATGIQYASQRTFDLCEYFEEERPVGLQIFGESAEHLALAAQFLENRGADFIDINLGCPVSKVVSKGGGSAMLKDPAKLFTVLATVKKALRQIPLTIKIRTGWDACSINASECIAAAAEAGVLWVAVHGRTRAQGYEGSADWELIAKIKEKSPLPIIGNGDVLTAEQAISRRKDYGVDAVMIGRGALRNPFIFQEIAEIEGFTGFKNPVPRNAYWELISRHYEMMLKKNSMFHTGVQLRKFMTWYSAGIEGASQFRKELYSLPPSDDPTSVDTVVKLGEHFFKGPSGTGVHKQASFLREPFLKGGHG